MFLALTAIVVAAFVASIVWLFISVGELRRTVETNVHEISALEEAAPRDPAAPRRIRELRRQNAIESARLRSKWDQMYAIAVAAVVFSVFNVLLVSRLRRSAARLSEVAEDRYEAAVRHHGARVATLNTLGRGLAHEINNPLGWIASNVEWLRGEAIPAIADLARRDEAAEVLRETEEGVSRLKEIVRGLQALTAQGARSSEATELRPAAEAALRMLADQLAAAAAELSTEWAEVPRVHCSAAQVDQIVSALVTNAIQSFPEEQRERRIRVSAAPAENGRVVLQVQDNGPGFSAAARASIFEPFVSIDPRRKGLGLFVCKRIAEDCGGDVEVLDGPGGGAVVRVILPTG